MRNSYSAAAVAMVPLLITLEAARSAADGDMPVDSGLLGRFAGSLRDRVLDVVGPDEIVDRLDVNAVLERIDVAAVMERIDINAVLTRVDLNALLERVDLNALLERVDLDALLERVDVDRLLARVDLDAAIAHVDVEQVVRRAGIAEIIADSTGSMVERTLDLVRRHLVGLDVVATRAVMRILSREEHARPTAPPALARDAGSAGPGRTSAMSDVTGQYAGPTTRLVAFLLDMTLAGGAFTLFSGALGSILRTAGVTIAGSSGGGVLFPTAAVVWLFAYWWASTAVAGRTPGMALVGLRVVARSGAPVSGGRAFIRVVILPLSILLLGVGLLVMLVDHERRALHDVAAGSTVVYDWGGRGATLPTPLARWLEQHSVQADASVSP